MIMKSRTVPEELKHFRCLNVRIDFSKDDDHYYTVLEKGFQGEKKFDALIGDLSDNWIIINDLLLKYNHTLFQIDSLLISHDLLYANDVKNYEGDYYLEKDRLYKVSKKEIKSPSEQLIRGESLLRRLLHDLGFNLPIESRLVFVNPEFFLYHAPINLPAVFPSQLDRFIKKFKMKSGKLSNWHFQLGEKLVSLHIKKGPLNQVPAYSYEQLKKGIVCSSCWHSFMSKLNTKILVCTDCGHKENIDAAVLRSAEEFSMLFPDRKITTSAIFEWCRIIESRKTIWRVLGRNYILVKNGRASYYEKKEEMNS